MTFPRLPLSNNAIRTLAIRATTICERIEGNAISDSCSYNEALQRSQLWTRLATVGDEVSMTAFLKEMGHSPTSIIPLLGSVSFPSDHPIKGWISDLPWILEAIQSSSQTQNDNAETSKPIPFGELFESLTETASLKRDSNLHTSHPLISVQARCNLKSHLLSQIVNLFAPHLLEAFELFKLKSQLLPHVLLIPGEASSNEAYTAFINDLRTSEFPALLNSKPVLGRLLAVVISQWIDATSLFLSRLSEDWREISEHFQPEWPVSNIQYNLSDHHNGGQCVYRLTFTNGVSLLYKPKPLKIDACWEKLISWLEHNGLEFLPKAPKTLSCDSYGWQEWIAPQSIDNIEQAHYFFRRSGTLLFFLYLAQGTDCHFENVIAHGEHPTLVDLETLFHPWLASSSKTGPHNAIELASKHLKDSVLATGYLPNWTVLPGGKITGEGGLSPGESRIVKLQEFLNVNTDAMSLQEAWETSTLNFNVPDLHETGGDISLFIDDVVLGFTTAYKFLAQNKSVFCSRSGPLESFFGLPVRVILRPTRFYDLMLKRSLQSQNVADGVLWGANFDLLYSLGQTSTDNKRYQEIIKAEQAALQRLDIPLFWTYTNSADLHFLGGRIQGVLESPSWNQVINRVKGLCTEKMDEQVEFIRNALKSARPENSCSAQGQDYYPQDFEEPFSSSLALAYSQHVFDILHESAFRADGGATWTGGIPLYGEDRYQLEVVGFDLYSGASGIALFLGAFAAIRNIPEARRLALEALAPIRNDLRDPGNARKLASSIGIGGAAGLGSIVYTFLILSTTLEREDLLEDAHRAAMLISRDRILADRDFDVIGGCAGSILGLLRLYSVSQEPQLLNRAIECGNLLLSKSSQKVRGAWASPFSSVPLTGFSHGAAGIALALMRLYAATEDKRYLEAAKGGIEYERSVFSREHGNWPDFRISPYKPAYLAYWCHGATGIGLARLGILQVAPEYPGVIEEIESALQTTLNTPTCDKDHLCCGNFGRIEFLFSAGLRLDRPQLTRIAQAKCAQLLHRQRRTKEATWPAGKERENPGFFSGISGAGYQVLRLIYPERLPSILMWEGPRKEGVVPTHLSRHSPT